MKIYAFALSSLLFLQACQHSAPQERTYQKQHLILKGVAGTKINSYIKNNKTNNYQFTLAENLGHKRTETEQAMMQFILADKTISFTILSDTHLTQLETPLTIFEIYDKNHQELMKLTIKENYAWIETSEKDVKQVPLYLSDENAFIQIQPSENHIDIKINNKHYKFSLKDSAKLLLIGLKRYDLMRYVGKKIPQQTLKIEDVIF